jgi:small subunit ribosomal protein S20
LPGKGSAAKRQRQNDTHRLRNRMSKSAVRTQTKKFTEAVKVKDKVTAEKELLSVIKMMDSAAGKKVYHKNTVARKKSRLSKMLNTLA